jgi:hypothetical protein
VLGGKAGRHPCGIAPHTCSLSSELQCRAVNMAQIRHAPDLAS